MAKKLHQLTENAEKINGHHNIPLYKLLTNTYIKNNTDFNTLNEFLNVGNITKHDLENQDTSKLDNFTRQYSSFNNFQDLLNNATKEWGINKIMH